MNSKEIIKEIEDEWKKEKKVSNKVMTQILNNILNKSNILAIKLSETLNLPSPIPLPTINQDKE